MILTNKTCEIDQKYFVQSDGDICWSCQLPDEPLMYESDSDGSFSTRVVYGQNRLCCKRLMHAIVLSMCACVCLGDCAHGFTQ